MHLKSPSFFPITSRSGRSWHSRFLLVLILLLALANLLPAGQALSSRPVLVSPNQQAADLLQTLTPEERVGQLFLVSFSGTEAGAESQIYDLITNYHVGGIVLQAGNDNFGPPQGALNQAVTLTRQLQLNEWAASQQSRVDPASGEGSIPAYIPLFIGVAQEGDGYPYDQILEGLTPLPNAMALGATWNPDLADQAGNVLGQELAALGINLLLGPSLDVLESPHMEGSGDLSTRTFGGDPFWVGKMGSAFIRGVHEGSQGRLAIIAKHFPGYGGSDRLPDEEVATVIKSLDQLKDFDLQPFFAVTGSTADPIAVADGLLASHIRYQNFQGNLRATTRPISFDPVALSSLMGLPPLDQWRRNGGVIVSDDLGSRAVRGFYEFTNQPFDPIRVTRNAFQAGNDLLYVADFSTQNDPDSYTAAVRTLQYFTQKYREDALFAQSVDRSVERILALKFRMYKNFGLGPVLASTDANSQVGRSSQVTLEVARQAATLISPSQADLEATMPDPPNLNDRIVFFSDTRLSHPCTMCQPQPVLDVRALEQVVLGRAGGQVSPNNLVSYSLEELTEVLDAGRGETDLEISLERANWIVFAMLNASEDMPSYSTLRRFLAERPDLFQQKRLIVFAFGAPYYLDATNITKLTAYYALYSKGPQFLEMAAYLLFRELPAEGALPVSVPGVSYDLNAALFPNPGQVIPLQVDLPGSPVTDTLTTSTPAPSIEFRVGDVIPLRTGVILDHNGHPVPDGTQVEFVINMGGELRQTELTLDGIARTTILVSNSGSLAVTAESERARSQTLRFEIPSANGEAPPPTATEQPSPTPEPTATPTGPPPPVSTPVEPPPPSRPLLADWVMAILLTSAISFSAYRLAALIGQIRWGVRGGFLALIGGLLGYSYLALQMPGSDEVLRNSVSRGVLVITLLGCGLGLVAAWVWRAIRSPAGEKK